MNFSEKLLEVFNVLDKDEEKMISVKDLGKALRAAGMNPTESQIKEYIDSAVLINENKIDFQEFEKIANRCSEGNLVTKEEVLNYFMSFDINREEYLTYEDLKKALCSSGDKLEEKEIDVLLRDFDKENTGRVRIRDFIDGLFAV